MRCAIWYQLYNWKIVQNTHGGALRLVKLHSTVGVFHDFSIVQMVPSRAKHQIYVKLQNLKKD